jgi:hypothetical protein
MHIDKSKAAGTRSLVGQQVFAGRIQGTGKEYNSLLCQNFPQN